MTRFHDADLCDEKLQRLSVQSHLLDGHLGASLGMRRNKHLAGSTLADLQEVLVELHRIVAAHQLIQCEGLLFGKFDLGRWRNTHCATRQLFVGELEDVEHGVRRRHVLFPLHTGRLQHGLPFGRQARETGFRVEVHMNVVLHIEGQTDAFALSSVLDCFDPGITLGSSLGLDVEHLANLNRVQLEGMWLQRRTSYISKDTN
mmetsp:Transcript_5783/g.14700  ORF Transcript_5783/g.14700 Transcript_5783/m.14700 type:complete len:202 (+) Transcript_5783:717-1322(+)